MIKIQSIDEKLQQEQIRYKKRVKRSKVQNNDLNKPDFYDVPYSAKRQNLDAFDSLDSMVSNLLK